MSSYIFIREIADTVFRHKMENQENIAFDDNAEIAEACVHDAIKAAAAMDQPPLDSIEIKKLIAELEGTYATTIGKAQILSDDWDPWLPTCLLYTSPSPRDRG